MILDAAGAAGGVGGPRLVLAESTISHTNWGELISVLVFLAVFCLVAGAPIAFVDRSLESIRKRTRLYLTVGLALFLASHGGALLEWRMASQFMDMLGSKLTTKDIASGMAQGLAHVFDGWSALSCILLTVGTCRWSPRKGPWLCLGAWLVAFTVLGADKFGWPSPIQKELEESQPGVIVHVTHCGTSPMLPYELLVPVLTWACLLPAAMGACVATGAWSRRAEIAGGVRAVTASSGLLAVVTAGMAVCGAWIVHLVRIANGLSSPPLSLPWSAALLPPLVGGGCGVVLLAIASRWKPVASALPAPPTDGDGSPR